MNVHVIKGGREAKFWLRPEVRVAKNRGIDDRTLRRLAAVVEERRELIERAWLEHVG